MLELRIFSYGERRQGAAPSLFLALCSTTEAQYISISSFIYHPKIMEPNADDFPSPLILDVSCLKAHRFSDHHGTSGHSTPVVNLFMKKKIIITLYFERIQVKLHFMKLEWNVGCHSTYSFLNMITYFIKQGKLELTTAATKYLLS